ncbi:MAG: hypothetical protein M1816_003973 [Peltula sp. TS41687]|nr:MAG: hypothetical protein M1816_003973 [Peltula sp. TS41687]
MTELDPRSFPTTNTSTPGHMPIGSFTHGLTGVNQPMNITFTKALWLSFVGLCIIILLVRFAQIGSAHLRHLYSLTATAEQQSFWTVNRSSLWPNLKKHLLYAPLGKKRHNREIQLSSAINIGTLPSRFHFGLLTLYFLSNLAYCVALDYKDKSKVELCAQLRGRSGVLAVANMIPLFIMAGRNNPFIKVLRVSFDTYNLLHRWIGRMVVLESVVHTIAWMANQIAATGVKGIGQKMARYPFIQYGFLGTFAMLFIGIQSPSAIRHAFYETFLHLHQLAALLAVVGIYFHLSIDRLPQVPYIQAVICIWAFDRFFRFFRILYRCWSWREGFSNVQVEALPGEACRVTVELRRPWTYKPGCHVYIYLPSISFHQSHPFSVAWCDQTSPAPAPRSKHDSSASADEEKLPKYKTDLDRPAGPTTVSLVIHKRTGMTARLYDRAAASPNGRLSLRGVVEGPYGSLESLHSYGTVILFAGGIGITHQVSHIRDLIQGYADGSVATRKIVLIWTVRTTEHLEWVRPWMDDILQMPGRREILKILLFVTKPKSPREVISPSATVQMYPGRPQPQVILDKEIDDRIGTMAVTVCGPGSLADSVRQAARKRADVVALDFVEESFTW